MAVDSSRSMRMGNLNPDAWPATMWPASLDDRSPFRPFGFWSRLRFPLAGPAWPVPANDVLAFLEAVRSGGLLQSQTRRAMFTVHARTLGHAEGPGWEFGYGGAVLVDAKAADTPQAPGTLQWNGAYGHKWFIDPANELTVVALSNTTFEGMTGRFTSGRSQRRLRRVTAAHVTGIVRKGVED